MSATFTFNAAAKPYVKSHDLPAPEYSPVIIMELVSKKMKYDLTEEPQRILYAKEVYGSLQQLYPTITLYPVKDHPTQPDVLNASLLLAKIVETITYRWNIGATFIDLFYDEHEFKDQRIQSQALSTRYRDLLRRMVQFLVDERPKGMMGAIPQFGAPPRDPRLAVLKGETVMSDED